MNTEETHHDPRLERWLAIACWGLADSAKQRIRGEIAAHYLDAFEHYESQEIPKAEAEENAVQELGSPRWAWWRLRRVHLTAREEKEIRRLGTLEAKAGLYITYFLAALAVIEVCVMLPRQTAFIAVGEMWVFQGVLALCGGAFPAIVVALGVKAWRAERVQRHLLRSILMSLSMGCYACGIGTSNAVDEGLSYWSIFMFFNAGSLILIAYSQLRLLRKVRNVDLPDDVGPTAGDA